MQLTALLIKLSSLLALPMTRLMEFVSYEGDAYPSLHYLSNYLHFPFLFIYSVKYLDNNSHNSFRAGLICEALSPSFLSLFLIFLFVSYLWNRENSYRTHRIMFLHFLSLFLLLRLYPSSFSLFSKSASDGYPGLPGCFMIGLNRYSLLNTINKT